MDSYMLLHDNKCTSNAYTHVRMHKYTQTRKQIINGIFWKNTIILLQVSVAV